MEHRASVGKKKMSGNIFDNPYIDITANNHGGNKQSQDANIKLAPYKLGWKEKILGFMAQRDEQGLGTSCRHAADHFGKEAGQIGGRFTELKVAGVIEPTMNVENDYMVYRLRSSNKVPLNNNVRKRLLVVGVGLAGEIVFEKTTGGWQIATITPKLRDILAETPIPDIGKRLDALHLTHTWVEA